MYEGRRVRVKLKVAIFVIFVVGSVLIGLAIGSEAQR
jgi:uncharacterized protein (DUF983 family)